MKLYTEEQVNELRRALRDIAQWDEYLEEYWEDAGNMAMDALRSFNKLIPIELPNDEEIEKASFTEKYQVAFNPFASGVKWLIDKIKGGNK